MPSFSTAYIPRTLIYKSVTCSERAKNDQSAELRVHTNCLAEEPRVGGLPAPSNSKGRLQILHSVSVCTIWFISNCIRNGNKFPAKASLLVFGGALNAQMLSKILYEKVACHLLESIYVECVESACYCRHRCRLAFSWPRRTLVELLLSRCLCLFCWYHQRAANVLHFSRAIQDQLMKIQNCSYSSVFLDDYLHILFHQSHVNHPPWLL